MTESTNPAGRKITLSEAKKIVKQYTENCAETDIRSITFSAEFLRSIIDQEQCEYVKFYLCKIDESAKPKPLGQGHSIMVVGADSNEKVLLKGENDDDDNDIYEYGKLCPPICADDDCFEF